MYERLRPTHLAEKFIYSSANNIAPSHSLSQTHTHPCSPPSHTHALQRTRTHALQLTRTHALQRTHAHAPTRYLVIAPSQRDDLEGNDLFVSIFFLVPVGEAEDCEHFEEIHNNAVQDDAAAEARLHFHLHVSAPTDANIQFSSTSICPRR